MTTRGVPWPWKALTNWNIEIKNITGSATYVKTNCNNTLVLNETLLPRGLDTIKISRTGYRERIIYITITTGVIFTQKFYLPVMNLTVTPQLYDCQVVETIQTAYSSYNQPVSNAIITFKRYINTTGGYSTLSSLITDSNGMVNLWLFPSQIYLVSINATGFNDGISDYIPAPANLYGQTELKQFRLYRQTSGGVNITSQDTLFHNIIYTLQPISTRHTTGFKIYYNITSLDSKLEWFRLDIYYKPTSATTYSLLYTHNTSSTTGGSISYTILNNSGTYQISCWFKKTGYNSYEIYNIGSMTYFIIRLRTTAALIPDEAYFIIMLILALVLMGSCIIYFSTGPITGYIGLGFMAFMLYLHNDITIDTGIIPMTGWAIWGITFLLYSAALFLWSRL